MRLWSLHPQYLDAKGLVALWREGLLAQKVLMGQTKGYQNHPQLIRFKAYPQSLQAIANYLHGVCDEACRRKYSFNRDKILKKSRDGLLPIKVTKGQLAYELEHLKKKLLIRDKAQYQTINQLERVVPHSLFKPMAGGIAEWEKI